MLGIGADAFGGRFERLTLLGGDGVPGLFQTRARQFQIGGRGRRPAIEARGIVQERGVAPRPHLADDLGDGLLDPIIGDRLPGQQPIETGVEI